MLTPITEMLRQINHIDLGRLSKQEKIMLEAALFARLHDELLNAINYQLINISTEDKMLESSLIQNLIKDILLTEEYSLAGIAYHTHTPEEVIYEIAMGIHTNPSTSFARKIIELHKSTRPHLYENIFKKISAEIFMPSSALA